MRQQHAPWHRDASFDRSILHDPRVLFGAQFRVQCRTAKCDQPPHNPPRAEHPGREERALPAVAHGQPRHDKWRQQRTNVRARIEDAGGKGALASREPFSNRLYRSRKVHCFRQSKSDARGDKAHESRRHGVRCAGYAPHADTERVSATRADAVEESTHAEQSDGVGELERGHQMPVVLFTPVQRLLQVRRQDAQHLAIEIVERGREEEQGAHAPSIPPARGRQRHRFGGHRFGKRDGHGCIAGCLLRR